MTSEEREEIILRARAAARNGHSLNANPYHPERQRKQWNLWRLAFADATPGPDGPQP